MIQMLVAVSSVSFLILKIADQDKEAWFWLFAGLAMLLISIAIFRINSGIRKNAEVLSKTANAIGDIDIPVPQNVWKTVTHYIVLATGFFGFAMVASGVFLLASLGFWCEKFLLVTTTRMINITKMLYLCMEP